MKSRANTLLLSRICQQKYQFNSGQLLLLPNMVQSQFDRTAGNPTNYINPK